MTNSLESSFKNAFTHIDINACCDFPDFLDPNEPFPEEVRPHLSLAEKGIIVSTGTERSLFNLLLSENCEGLAVVDINPKVKAYIDFNTLLLRLSCDREEYLELSAPGRIAEKIEILSNKMRTAHLPTEVQDYYTHHLPDFAAVFLNRKRWWNQSGSFRYSSCRYDLNDTQFLKLQKYARMGNIISFVGIINDLTFFKGRTISVVDTSNISDYEMIDLRGPHTDFRPRVIHTVLNTTSTTYTSYVHQSLTEDERHELDACLSKISRASGKKPHLWMTSYFQNSRTNDAFNDDTGPFYTKNTLTHLQEAINASILEIPSVGSFDMKGNFADKFNAATDDEIYKISSHENTKSFLKAIITNWNLLNPTIYLRLMKIENWKEEFERHFKSSRWLNIFLENLQKSSLYDLFVTEFGQERLNALRG